MGGVGALAATLALWVEACGFAREGKREIASVEAHSMMSAVLTSNTRNSPKE